MSRTFRSLVGAKSRAHWKAAVVGDPTKTGATTWCSGLPANVNWTPSIPLRKGGLDASTTPTMRASKASHALSRLAKSCAKSIIVFSSFSVADSTFSSFTLMTAVFSPSLLMSVTAESIFFSILLPILLNSSLVSLDNESIFSFSSFLPWRKKLATEIPVPTTPTPVPTTAAIAVTVSLSKPQRVGERRGHAGRWYLELREGRARTTKAAGILHGWGERFAAKALAFSQDTRGNTSLRTEVSSALGDTDGAGRLRRAAGRARYFSRGGPARAPRIVDRVTSDAQRPWSQSSRALML
mmetsp:Transcript_28515/g.69413  ORF Transcript_28515/g.69413 Transcript_28515/m.69413 type:complete len:296 (-) Transcript_28515:42-929(-)